MNDVLVVASFHAERYIVLSIFMAALRMTYSFWGTIRRLQNIYLGRAVMESRDLLDEIHDIHKSIIYDFYGARREAYVRLIDLISLRIPIPDDILSFPAGEQCLSDFPLFIDEACREGISLVTCSMNRTENLLKSLKTWIVHEEISEIIIVDWCSEIPISMSLDRAGICDDRIRIVRVDDEEGWILSYAFNVGFRVSRREYVLKVDADVTLSDDFFEKNKLNASTNFIAGNWRAGSAKQIFVNGFFFAPLSALAAIGGFNEFITTYGWDDDDLYARLEAAGYVRQDVADGTIRHLYHTDNQRTGDEGADCRPAIEVMMKSTRFMIQRNRILCEIMPSWSSDRPLLPLRIKGRDRRLLTLTRAGEHVSVVPREIFDRVSFEVLQTWMSLEYGSAVLELDPDVFLEIMQMPLSKLSDQLFLEAVQDQARTQE